MRFASPEWLILLPLIAIVAWRWPRLGLLRPLRATLVVLLLLLLMRPEIRRLGAGLDVWVLADRSNSAEEWVQPRLPEMQALLERSKGLRDRLHWVDFADVAVSREAADAQVFPGTRRQTRLASALQYTLAQLDPDRAARLLVVTDGFSTEPLGVVEEKLRDQQVALDYRLVGQPDASDYRVADLDVPARVQRGEPFLVEARITGTPDGKVPFAMQRNGALIASGEADVKDGTALLRFTDHLNAGGAHRYVCKISATNDARTGNNVAERWVEQISGPRCLLVTAYTDDPLAAALRGQGFEVDVRTDFTGLDVGSLAGARGVMINNVPAWRLPENFLRALDFHVRSQGAGLLMAGGKTSFGAGGYFQSPLDPLLPVSMELKQEHRKLAVAMAIVLDRSGSMAVGVPGSHLTKMDLANEGSARGIELLGAMDAVSVIAVDSEPHVMVPLTRLGDNRNEIISATRRIQSSGGGIYVYTGLKAGWEEVKGAGQGQRHIILFADAADAEEPGDYIRLLAEITADGGTVSVIGMGTEADTDAEFLKDVALRGGGRIFFNADPATLPAVFAQETIAVARSAYLAEPVALSATAAWMEMAARPIEWLPAVDGYNLSYLREEATGAAFSGDEYAAPLVAFWQRGIGRVAAVSFPLGGPGSELVRAWPACGDFVRTMGRWLMGRDTPPGIALRTQRAGNTILVDLLYNESWEEELARNAPAIAMVSSASDAIAHPTWQRMEPGRYSVFIPMDDGEWWRGAVQVADVALPFGPLNAGTDAEWSFDRERVAELKRVAARSGGEERLDLSTVWDAPRRKDFSDIQAPLLILLLLVLLVEAAVSRIHGYRPARAVGREQSHRTMHQAPPLPVQPKASPPPPSMDSPPTEKRSVFDQAKRRGR